MTINAANLNQNSVCFQHNFPTTKGILIVENVDRSRDIVPKDHQLSWSDIVFYTYKDMNGDDASKLQYIFYHSIINEEAKKQSTILRPLQSSIVIQKFLGPTRRLLKELVFWHFWRLKMGRVPLISSLIML